MNRTPQRQPSVPVPPMLGRQMAFRRRIPAQKKEKKADSTKRKLKLKQKAASSPRKQTPKQQQKRTRTGYSHVRNGTEKYNYAEIPLAQLNAFLNGPNAYNAYLKKHVMK